MDPLTLAIGIPVATLTLLVLGRKKPSAVIEPIDLGEIENPVVEPKPVPPGPLPPGAERVPVVPPGGELPPNRVATAQVSTPSGVRLRKTPMIANGNTIAVIPNGAFLAIMKEGPPLPPSPADAAQAPGGWQEVTTTNGLTGFVSAALITFLPRAQNPLPPPEVAGDFGSLGWEPWRGARRR